MHQPSCFSSDALFIALLLALYVPLAGLGALPLFVDAMHLGEQPSQALMICGFLMSACFGIMSVRLAYRLYKPDTLVIDDSGLTVTSLGRRRAWKWAEIEKTKSTLVFGTVSSQLVLYLKTNSEGSRLPIFLGLLWKAPSDRPAASVISDAINRRLAATPP